MAGADERQARWRDPRPQSRVSTKPSSPKSSPWLLARVTTSTPAVAQGGERRGRGPEVELLGRRRAPLGDRRLEVDHRDIGPQGVGHPREQGGGVVGQKGARRAFEVDVAAEGEGDRLAGPQTPATGGRRSGPRQARPAPGPRLAGGRRWPTPGRRPGLRPGHRRPRARRSTTVPRPAPLMGWRRPHRHRLDQAAADEAVQHVEHREGAEPGHGDHLGDRALRRASAETTCHSTAERDSDTESRGRVGERRTRVPVDGQGAADRAPGGQAVARRRPAPGRPGSRTGRPSWWTWSARNS